MPLGSRQGVSPCPCARESPVTGSASGRLQNTNAGRRSPNMLLFVSAWNSHKCPKQLHVPKVPGFWYYSTNTHTHTHTHSHIYIYIYIYMYRGPISQNGEYIQCRVHHFGYFGGPGACCVPFLAGNPGFGSFTLVAS